MARKNKLDLSLPAIVGYFEILNRNGHDWNIQPNRNTSRVLDYLLKREMLAKNSFINDSNEVKFIYSWKTQDEYTVISGLKSDSYFAYYSSLFLHQLTLQIPKTVYLNFEHKREIRSNDSETNLTQEAIDNAFNGSQRKSSLTFSFNDKKIVLTNGKFTNKLGVVKRQNNNQWFEYTNLERTLIDIAVRPVYAGGVFEVIEAYKIAKGKLNVRRLVKYLEKLNYIYPYYQVIGFYLEKAGYPDKDVEFLKKEMKFNFYLTYDIRKKEFSEKWKLYYPKGI
jgi:predicted transcriptional regulator of viral defense system